MPSKIIDPWGSELVEDYEKIIKNFGLEIFDSKLFPNPNRLMRRKVIFGGRDLKQISDTIKQHRKFYVLSGIMPSAEKIHFGNKMVIENIRYFQERGADGYVLVADLEAAAARGISLEEARKRALNFHIPAYIALGLNTRKTIFYFQSENLAVTNFAYEASKKITLNEFRAIYGSGDPGKIMSALTQTGDILYPQFKERMPGIIPIGIDQDPHVRLTRDIVRRTKTKYNFFFPSSIYHKYTPSLNGGLKMSKSKPHSCIELPENPQTACAKLKRALTGGRETLEIQKKKGGQPEKCMVFEMHKQHLIKNDKELDKIYNNCKTGKLLCKECKQIACEKMQEFMVNFIKKLKSARKKVDGLKFIK